MKELLGVLVPAWAALNGAFYCNAALVSLIDAYAVRRFSKQFLPMSEYFGFTGEIATIAALVLQGLDAGVLAGSGSVFLLGAALKRVRWTCLNAASVAIAAFYGALLILSFSTQGSAFLPPWIQYPTLLVFTVVTGVALNVAQAMISGGGDPEK